MRYIIILVCMITVSSCEQPNCMKSKLMIMDVGGCNDDGLCGVIFSDGHKGTWHFPVKTEEVETMVCGNKVLSDY